MSDKIVTGLSKTKRRKLIVDNNGPSVGTGDRLIIGDANIKEVGKVLDPDPEPNGESTEWRVIRQANDHDLLQTEMNQSKAEKAVPIAQQLADKRSLQMKVIGSEYSLEKSQLKFYFKSPHRVDFRGLVKALAHEYSTRIELEQVGPRDAASILGGVGRCGQELCCRRFLYDPGPVPMEIAEKQGLSVSPDRLTGVCGRLLCCLEYELEGYVESLKEMPDKGSKVESPDGEGKVVKRNVQKETLRVRLDNEKVREFPLEEIETIESD